MPYSKQVACRCCNQQYDVHLMVSCSVCQEKCQNPCVEFLMKLELPIAINAMTGFVLIVELLETIWETWKSWLSNFRMILKI